MANPSNESWTLFTGLANPYPGDADAISHHPYRIPRTDDQRAVPNLKVIERLDGATVVRLAFRPGDSMADHTAPARFSSSGKSGRLRSRFPTTTAKLRQSALSQELPFTSPLGKYTA